MNPSDVPDGPLVVDTDVASWIRTGHRRAEPFKALLRDHVLCLSFATVGELWAGAEIAGWAQARRDGLAAFVRVHVVLPVDDEVARWSGPRPCGRPRPGGRERRVDRGLHAGANTVTRSRHGQPEALPVDRGQIPWSDDCSPHA